MLLEVKGNVKEINNYDDFKLHLKNNNVSEISEELYDTFVDRIKTNGKKDIYINVLDHCNNNYITATLKNK